MPPTSPSVVSFDVYTLDLQRCALRRGDEEIELRPKAFDVLRYLVENRGRVIRKEELIQAVWSGVAVTDDALVQCVRDVRQALSDEAHRIIKTVPRRGYLLSVEPTESAAPRPVPVPLNQRVEFCRTKDGVKLAMAATGQGLPLVRPPTWFNHLEYDWHVPFRSALYRFLAERYRLIRYDGRGNGLSDRYVPEISFATFEHDLEAVIDACRLQRYALLGISQGAPIAIAHAVRYPERVSRLVLNGGFALGTSKRGSTKDHETAQAQLTLMRHGWGDEHSAYLRTFGMLYFPSASAEELRASAELQRMAMTADTAVQLRLACADIDVTDLLPRVTAPTLILHSRHDNAVPFEEGRRLAAGIPNARFVALESENHVPTPDEPAWPTFIGEIEAFLATP
jgi:pimeloyl-ACP methyl ester carboxylesterase/DNA-binding winged helix-turn-helix (wHTH) protein